MAEADIVGPIKGGSAMSYSQLIKLEEQLWGIRRKMNGHPPESKIPDLQRNYESVWNKAVGIRQHLGLDPTPELRRPPRKKRKTWQLFEADRCLETVGAN
jgi:hypothetical protein